MKDFFKNILATVFGVFLCIGIFIAFSIISLIGMVASTSTETEVKDNSVLVLNLQGQITEKGSSDPFAELLGNEQMSTGLNDILSAIEKAKDNDDIKGIYIETGALVADNATIQEIRNKLKEFKAKKKWIVAYGEIYTQGAYYLASVADKVYINPYGHLDFQWCIFVYRHSVVYGGSNGSSLSPSEFQHRLYVFSEERSLNGHFIGKIGVDDASHPFENMSKLEV